MNEKDREILTDLGACKDAVEWAEAYDTLADAWAACGRGDWMLWYAAQFTGGPRSKSRKRLVLAACGCARLALPHIPDDERRPLQAVETAEAWARGERGVTLAGVRDAAAYAAHAAYAAADAADAAAHAAYAAYTAYAAAYAADAAAHAARGAVLARCADIMRQHYPTIPEAK